MQKTLYPLKHVIFSQKTDVKTVGLILFAIQNSIINDFKP